MEQIAVETKNQKKFSRKTKKLKKRVEKGEVKVGNEANAGAGTKVQRKPRNEKERGGIYVGHLPHGFYERELASYFKQFGTVTRVVVRRSQKSGKSKGYGFVEFFSADVAKIAAETMNNYLMFDRIVKCSFIPPKKCKNILFTSIKSKFNYPGLHNRLRDKFQKNRELTACEMERRRKRVKSKLDTLKALLKEQGIKYRPKVVDCERKEKKKPGSLLLVKKRDDRDIEQS